MQRCWLALWLPMTWGCSSAVAPRFASWDPVREDLPAAPDRRQALQRLDASYALWRLWQERGSPEPQQSGRPRRRERAYSYLRAHQASETEVTFTLLEVQRGRVVLRASFAADPAKLTVHDGRAGRRSLRPRWVERGPALGSHTDGAPLLTVDQLYAGCRKLLSEPEAMPARLYFHPDGLLMQCGFPPSQCAGCPSYSMSSLAAFSIERELPADNPAGWLCETATGPVVPGTALPLLPPYYVCHAPYRAEPPPEGQGEEGQEEEEEGVDDICRIDSRACPSRAAGPGAAFLTQWRPEVCPSWPTHTPRPLEVGKVEPLAEWTFPFASSAGVECGGGVFLRPVRPNVDPKAAPAYWSTP